MNGAKRGVDDDGGMGGGSRGGVLGDSMGMGEVGGADRRLLEAAYAQAVKSGREGGIPIGAALGAADGTVVDIVELEACPYYEGPCKRVSIFLSVSS